MFIREFLVKLTDGCILCKHAAVAFCDHGSLNDIRADRYLVSGFGEHLMAESEDDKFRGA